MEKNNFVYCILNNNKLDTIFDNINYAMNYIAINKNCIIKPKLLNSNLNFETIYYNPSSNNFYNKKQFFYIDHPHINIKSDDNLVNEKKYEVNNNPSLSRDAVEIDQVNNLKTVDQSNSLSENALNLFIPLGNDNDDEYYNIEVKHEETDNTKLSKNELLDKLKLKISNLKNLKEIEENDLSKISTMMENKKDNFKRNQQKFNKMKKQQIEKKEKFECLERKFKSDINTFLKMKKDKEDKKLNEIPELFKLKYNILLEMENNNQLNLENSLQIYLEKIPYIQEVYTIEDEQLLGIFGEYYLDNNSESSKDESNEESDSSDSDFDTEDN